jgi:hypothetical protein
MKEVKDLTFSEWNTGEPQSGEFVLRVGLMVRGTDEDEWTHSTFKLAFDEPEERDACIDHYKKLYS